MFFELQSRPVGKGLSCFSEEESVNNNYESFRGLYFESDNSIRVVSFKSKNKSLKIISKLTPYKISENSVKISDRQITQVIVEVEINSFKLSPVKLLSIKAGEEPPF